MNLRRPSLQLAATVGAVLLAAWWCLRPHGPTYQGRDVRGWLLLREREPYSEGVQPDVLAALRTMGTNAISPLVEACFDQPPVRYQIHEWFRTNAPWFANQIPDGMRDWLLTGSGIGGIAYDAIDKLRPPAAVLIPLLTNRLNHPYPDYEYAMRPLAAVGDDQEAAARMLGTFLRNSTQFTARLLKDMGPAITVVLPELTTNLSIATPDAAFEIIGCLGVIGPAASNTLLSIRTRFQAEGNLYRRLNIARCAIQIGSPDFWAENEVRSALVGANIESRYAVANYLKHWTNISPRFELELRNLALRVEEDSDPDPYSSSLHIAEAIAAQALGNANLDHSHILPVLANCLRSPHCYVRVYAADKLLELEPANRPAFACLTNVLADPPYRHMKGYRPFHDFTRTGREYGRLVVRLAKIAPANPEARRTLDALDISASELSEAEARLAKADYPEWH